jgi:phosphatidylglycerol:prolipoprotein diacylglycerol transferase
MGVIGARLYYIIFDWSNYAGDFFRIINIRNGGLAIHGGLILGFLTAVVLCRLWNVRPVNLLDLVAPAIAIAQSIGRWGNYFNSEAHGGPTNLPWAISADGQMVHPTFLYESIWCFVLFFVLIFIDNRRKFEGQTFLLYGILYSVERFFVEGLRTDSLMVGPFRQAQILSAAVFVIFLILYIMLRRKSKYRNRIFY